MCWNPNYGMVRSYPNGTPDVVGDNIWENLPVTQVQLG